MQAWKVEKGKGQTGVILGPGRLLALPLPLSSPGLVCSANTQHEGALPPREPAQLVSCGRGAGVGWGGGGQKEPRGRSSGPLLQRFSI